MHHFNSIPLLFWAKKQKYTYRYTYTYTYTYTHTGHMTVMLEDGGNFENGMPIPDYQINLVLDQVPYDWRTKSNIQE